MHEIDSLLRSFCSLSLSLTSFLLPSINFTSTHLSPPFILLLYSLSFPAKQLGKRIMTTISEGLFCIREYVSTMRSVDEGMCWPFDGEISRAAGERSTGDSATVLPPMNHRRFRWWSFELDRSRSLSGIHRDPDVCTASECPETTAADVLAQDLGLGGEDGSGVLPPAASDGQDDDTPADGRRKANGRVHKKRSIVEIFANAPEVVRSQQIDTSVDLHEDSSTEKKKKKTLLKRNKQKRRRRKKKMITKTTKIGCVKDLGKVVVTKKRKLSANAKESKETKATKMTVVESAMEISGNALKPCSIDRKKKLHILARSSERSEDALTGRQLGKKTEAPISTHKRASPDAKKLWKKYSLYEKGSSKPATKCEKDKADVPPVSSILKTRARTGIQETSTKRNDKADQNLGVCSGAALQKVRHVRFSDKDDIIGQTTLSSPLIDSVESPQEFSELMAATSLHKLSCAATETDGTSEKVNENTAKESVCFSREVFTILVDGNGNRIQNENNQVKDSLDGLIINADTSSHSRNSSGMSKSSALDCVDLNDTIGGASMTAARCIGQPAIQRQQNLNSILRTDPDVMQAQISTPWLSNVSRRLQTIEQADRSDVSAPIPCLSKSIYSRESPLIMENEPVIVKSQPDLNSESCFFHYPSGFPLPIPEGRSSSILTELVPARRDCWVSTSGFQPIYNSSIVSRREKKFHEDFVGLPLNSRGGLTQMQDQIFRRQAVVTGSANAHPLSNVIGSRDIGGCKSLHRTLHGSMDRSTDELNLFPEMHYTLNDLPVASGSKSPFDLNHLERVEDDSESHNIFGVGSRKLNHCLCHKGKDKIEAFDFFSSTQSDSLPSVRLMGKIVTVGRNGEMDKGSRDPVRWVDKEIIAEQKPPFPDSDMGSGSLRFQQIIQPFHDPKFFTWSFNNNPQLVCKDRFPVSMESYGTAGNSVAQRAVSNYPLQILDAQVTVNEPSKINYQKPLSTSGSLDAFNHPDHVYYGTASTFRFSNPNLQNSTKLSWDETDNSGIPPWLLNASIKDSNVLSSQIYYDPTYRQCLFDLPNSSPSPPKSYLTTSFPSAFLDIRPDSSMPSTYHHAHLTSLPLSNHHNSSCSFVEHSSALNHTGKSIFDQKVSGSKTLAFNGGAGTNSTVRKMKSGHAPSIQGRNLAPKKLKRKCSANWTQTTASFNSFMREIDKAQNGSAKDQQTQEYLQCEASSVSLDIGGGKAINAPSCGIVNDSRTGSTRPGPMKLSAGVKHIIKPGQRSDTPGSTMTHSTLPFVGMPSGNNLGLKKKAARIYRF